MCFEILGFDIMLDQNLKPWLIEINHTPSFTTDTPLDKNIKQNVIADALRLMNISSAPRMIYKTKRQAELQQRVMTGKKTKVTQEGKMAAAMTAQQERDDWELNHLGSYERIYPLTDPASAEENYDEFLRVARKLWDGLSGIERSSSIKKSVITRVPMVVPPVVSMLATAFTKPSRTQQIQAIYSQKLAVGSTNKRPSSSQRPRKRPDTSIINRQNESLNNDFTENTRVQKNKRVGLNKKSDEIVQMALSQQNFNSETRCKPKDEKSYIEYLGFTKEHEDCHEVVNEDDFVGHFKREQSTPVLLKSETSSSMADSAENMHSSGLSLRIEDDVQINSHREQAAVPPYVIKRPQHNDIMKGFSPKIRPDSDYKKESNLGFKRAATPQNNQKLPLSLKNDIFALLKSSNQVNRGSVPIKEKPTNKPPAKMRGGHEAMKEFNEIMAYGSSMIEQEKKVKSFNSGNNRKLISMKGDSFAAINPNLIAAFVLDQQRNLIPNHLTLKTFETNTQQTPLSDKQNSFKVESKLFGKILSKGFKAPNQPKTQGIF